MIDSIHPQAPGFIRRMNPARDLYAVADLMEEAFQLKNDPEGRAITDAMRRQAGVLSDSGSSLVNRMLTRAAWSDGFVWEDQGKVVGNISLIPHLDGIHQKMMIANVSVTETYRRRGIARRLTLEGLDYCRQHRIREVFLQVKHGNTAAVTLYQKMGFEMLHSVSIWRLRQDTITPPDTQDPTGYEITHRHWSDWQIHKAWLENTYPSITRWYANLSFRALPPASWLNPFSWPQWMELDHFALRKNGNLMGMLTWQNRAGMTDTLLLALPADLESDEENKRAYALLHHFMKRYWRQGKVNLELPMGKATDGVRQAGFLLAHNLDWMRLRL